MPLCVRWPSRCRLISIEWVSRANAARTDASSRSSLTFHRLLHLLVQQGTCSHFGSLSLCLVSRCQLCLLLLLLAGLRTQSAPRSLRCQCLKNPRLSFVVASEPVPTLAGQSFACRSAIWFRTTTTTWTVFKLKTDTDACWHCRNLTSLHNRCPFFASDRAAKCKDDTSKLSRRMSLSSEVVVAFQFGHCVFTSSTSAATMCHT